MPFVMVNNLQIDHEATENTMKLLYLKIVIPTHHQDARDRKKNVDT